MKKQITRWLWIPVIMWVTASVFALPIQTEEAEERLNRVVLRDIRHAMHPGGLRIVLDLNRQPIYRITRISESSSLQIQFFNTIQSQEMKEVPAFPKEILQEFNLQGNQKDGQPNGMSLTMTLNELTRYRVFTLKEPDRVVIDLFQKVSQFPLPLAVPKVSILPPPSPPPPFEIKRVLIDPGHGGKDPGAISRHGLEEKDVVLDVSLRLKKLLQKDLKKEVILTRWEDRFIPLEERVKMANREKADLFVSVHANSSPKQTVKGVEIYFFGRATDEAAMATAARENAFSDINTQNMEEKVLSDLGREFNLDESLELAHIVEQEFVSDLTPQYAGVSLGVKRAPFYVLGHTKIPAILAEIAFLTNTSEEKLLRTSAYRQKIAQTIFNGIKKYLER